MAATQQESQKPQSGAEQRVRHYMLDDEEISYSLRFRPTGITNWIKSLLGFGLTYWFVTNKRLIETTKVGGGFTFRDVPHSKISSIKYGTKVSLVSIAIGIILSLTGLVSLIPGLAILIGSAEFGVVLLIGGLGLIGYAYWRRRQVLAIKASGGVNLALAISKGEQVDDFIWYLHAERNKHTD